jgi:chemotaxis-related protein WspD
MTRLKSHALPQLDCWNRIGTSGDRTCPELPTHIHCRNCPVFEAGARSFFERPAPSGYLDEWADVLDADVKPPDSKDVSVLIFRLGDEWLAVFTRSVVEVTSPRPFHRIPHRSGEILVGMINLRGRLQLQVSLHGLLGVAGVETREAEANARGLAAARLVVVQGDGQTWVFAAEEVVGVHRFPRGKLCAVPSTLANPAHSFSQAVIDWRGKSVGVLDDHRLFTALRGVGR